MSSIAMASTVRPSTGVAQRPATSLLLTRRGRLAVFVSCLAVACMLLVMIASAAIGSGEAGASVPTATVTVQSGDTLWGIAARVAPGEDPRDVIAQIEDLNAITGTVRAGDELAVPVAR